ncbi:MAG: hypothetical protein ABIO70_35850 [Pseudomonadota bacterium]
MSAALALLALTPGLALADPCAARDPALRAALDGAEQAFAEGRADDVRGGWAGAQRELACLAEPVRPETAVQLHLVEALVAFLDRLEEPQEARKRGEAAFRAALALGSGFEPSEALAIRGGPLWKWFEAARDDAAPSGPGSVYLCPPGATLLLDGTREIGGLCGRGWPMGRSAVVQVLEPSGRLRYSGLNPAGVARLPVEAFEASTVPTWPAPDLATGDEWLQLGYDLVPHPSRPLWWSAGGALAAAGGLYAAALLSERGWQRQVDACALEGQCWDDPAAAYERTEAMRRRTNVLGWGAVGVGGVGLTLGVVAWRVRAGEGCG